MLTSTVNYLQVIDYKHGIEKRKRLKEKIPKYQGESVEGIPIYQIT